MADKKNETDADIQKALAEDEEKIRKLVEETNEKFLKEMDGKPYLFVVSTLHEVGRDGDKSRLAAQWNWRSNIDSREEGRAKKEVETGRTLMKFLSDRLNEVVNHPEYGIKKKYKIE
ncbi:Uncharacterised protein [uncultured archaeon]|nr:Uncharacterised protein [uncultured archaeon]